MKLNIARSRFGLSLVAFAAIATPFAAAHTTGSSMASGLTHPLTGFDHLLALLGVGLWASRFEGRSKWLLPVAFVASMLMGSLLGFAKMPLPAVEPMIAASVMVFGLATLPRTQIAPWFGALLSGAFAIFHGHAHGNEFVGAGAATFAAGMLLTSTIIICAALGLGRVLFSTRYNWLGRAAGIGLALSGAWLMVG